MSKWDWLTVGIAVLRTLMVALVFFMWGRQKGREAAWHEFRRDVKCQRKWCRRWASHTQEEVRDHDGVRTTITVYARCPRHDWQDRPRRDEIVKNALQARNPTAAPPRTRSAPPPGGMQPPRVPPQAPPVTHPPVPPRGSGEAR